MASFSGPKLSNRIADDVPDIQAVLSSLAKLTPDSGNTDYPIGTKRVAETTNGYEFQQYNGTGWVTLEKWNLDAQKVDGYSASTGTTANTIPVRNANGKLPGDILGNAATATKANALSETNPIPMGGTGATTAEQARANLGTPPKTHASTSTEYGIGTTTQYGHLKSHDAPDATKTAATGHAFSPAGAAAMQDVLEGQIGDLAGVVSGNAASQAAKDAEQDESLAALRALIAEEVAKLLPLDGSRVMTGALGFGPYLGVREEVSADNAGMNISASSGDKKGAYLILRSNDAGGGFILSSRNEAGSASLIGDPAAKTLTWIGKNLVTAVNGIEADASGNVTISIPAKPKAYLNASGKSGNNWYRKYSDGFIMQGGRFSSSGGTLTLPTAFAGTGYAILLAHSGGDFYYGATYSSIKTTSFSIYANGRAGSWLAFGF